MFFGRKRSNWKTLKKTNSESTTIYQLVQCFLQIASGFGVTLQTDAQETSLLCSSGLLHQPLGAIYRHKMNSVLVSCQQLVLIFSNQNTIAVDTVLRLGEIMRYIFTFILAITFGSTAFAGAPSGFKEARFQGNSPVVKGKEVTFSIKPGQCSKKSYGDGRGESDCKNGNIRSQITNRKHARLGTVIEYAADIWVEPGFRYSKGSEARSKLTIMEWQRINTIKNHLFMLHLDSSGAKFENKSCFSSKQFGSWVSFKMQVKWSKNDDGFLRVFCNGRKVYELIGQNAIPPACGTPAKRQCALDKINTRPPVQWEVGPKLNGFGTVYAQFGLPSPFRPFRQQGLTMKMRSLYYGKLRN